MSSNAAAASASMRQPAIKEGQLIVLLGLTVILVIMNTTMFNFALPDIAKEYLLTPLSTSWIVTGYSIVFAISSITYSRLSDFIPIRRLIVIGLLSLSLAAIVGFFSVNYAMLLGARLVQASGAGAIISLSLVTLSRYVPAERRGKAMATVMSAVSLGLGLGPVAGGAIVEYLGWHVLFLVTAATLLLIPFLAGNVPAETPKKGSFDAIGAILIGIGTSGLLLFLTNHYLIALIAGLIALVLFAFRIRAAKNPFVLPALFANPQYLKVVAIGVIGYMCSFVTLFLLPQLLEHQYALKAVEAGFVIFPGSLLAMIVSRQVGRIIDTRGNLPILKYVPPFLLLAVVLFALLERTSYVTIIFLYMLLSVAFTFLSSSVSNEVSKILQPAQIGSGLGLLQLLQFFSGALGAALTASALGWQKNLMPAQAYSNIYWGLTIIAVLSIVSAVAYLRGRAARSL